MKNEKLTFVLSLTLTIACAYFAFAYLNFKAENESARDKNFAYEVFESFEHKYTDFKYKFREQAIPTARVALVAIDDDSLQEVGRWPWNRELMAKVTENLVKLGVTGVGFDVIQSEPDVDHPERDQKLFKVTADYADKIILGTFNQNVGDYQPYQDYCVTEAFAANGGEQLIKLNPTLSMDEPEDPFDTLRWQDLFRVLFSNARDISRIRYLRSIEKKSEQELSIYQKKYLSALQDKEYYDYCKLWLTKDDPFDWSNQKQLKELYGKIFSESSNFKGKSVEDVISELKKNTLFNVVPQSVEWTPNIPGIQNAAQYTASFTAYLDSDGYVRQYPLLYRTGQKVGLSYIPSLALQTYLVSQKYRAEIKFEKTKSFKKISSVKILNPQTEPETLVRELPVDFLGRLPINYYGRQMSVPYVSIKELLNDEPDIIVYTSDPSGSSNQFRAKREKISKLNFFKDRAVIVGATATGVYDLRNTPVESNYPGPEIHATMLANLIEGKILHWPKSESRYLVGLIIVIGLLLSLAWAYFEALNSAALFIVVFGLILSSDYLLFSKYNLLSSHLLLLTEVFLLYSFITIYKYFTEERKKKELKSTFSRYVSPSIVDEVLKQPENLKLGGRKQRMSVFFSDVRGFTTISEKLPPVELAKLLNDYLTPMTELVFKNKGTLDKYMGDAIMAFFGAPIFYENHAQMACRCALQNLEKLKELQKEFAAKNLPTIDIGIGINTGEMSVGNMGSTIVQNYTVMGDAVNLASRLEGINKEYGTRIIISEFTYQDVKDLFVCREVDRVRVKGKMEPVRIFELIREGQLSAEEQNWLATYEKASSEYLLQKFKESKDLYEACLILKPGDPVAKLYVERCEEYLDQAPPQNWDGVYVMKTK